MDIINRTVLSVFGPDFINIQAGVYRDENEDAKFKRIAQLDNILQPGLVKQYFKNNSLVEMIKQLKSLIKNQNKISAREAKILLTETGLSDLKNDIKYLSKGEVENRGLDLLVDFVEKLLIANKMEDMPPLEKEEDAAKRQQRGQGLKIMTQKQMITRLPILLAQLQAGNNSEKLKMK